MIQTREDVIFKWYYSSNKPAWIKLMKDSKIHSLEPGPQGYRVPGLYHSAIEDNVRWNTGKYRNVDSSLFIIESQAAVLFIYIDILQ